MQHIDIYKKVHGSLLTTPGDCTLYYTGDYSAHANEVNGTFVDNPPVLSPAYASVIWRYYPDTDRYLMVHVQGSHAVFPSQGRIYPYRAAFEVTRTDVNALIEAAGGRLPLTALFAAMPRIDDSADATSRRMPTEAEVDTRLATPTPQSLALAENIKAAVLCGRRLDVAIDVSDEHLRGNGILNSAELATLLGAIEQLPAGLARFATFGFCTDKRHEAFADDVLISIWPKDKAPADCLGWDEATSRTPDLSHQNAFISTAALTMPGKDKPFKTTAEMIKCFCQKMVDYAHLEQTSPYEMPPTDLQLWLSAFGHKIEEIPVGSWADASAIYPRLSAQQQAAFVALHRSKAPQWATEGITQQTYNAFALSSEAANAVRNRAFNRWESKEVRFLFECPEGKSFLVAHFTPEQLVKAVGGRYDRLVTLVGRYDFVPLEMWQRAFAGQNERLLKISAQLHAADIEKQDDAPIAPKKRAWLEALRTRLVLAGKPTNWAALENILMQMNDEETTAERLCDVMTCLASLSTQDYHTIVEQQALLLAKKAGHEPQEQLCRGYAEMASLAHSRLEQSRLYKGNEQLRDIHATMILAIAEFCKGEMWALCQRKQLLAKLFCQLVDRFHDGGPRLWRIFVCHFTLWSHDELCQLADFAELLARSIERSSKSKGTDADEAPLKLQRHHLDVIYHIAESIKSDASMSQENKDKAAHLIKCDTPTRIGFAQLAGRLPMSASKRMGILLLALLVGAGAGFIGAKLTKSPAGTTSLAVPTATAIQLAGNSRLMVQLAGMPDCRTAIVTLGGTEYALASDSAARVLTTLSRACYEADATRPMTITMRNGEATDTLEATAEQPLIALLSGKAGIVEKVTIDGQDIAIPTEQAPAGAQSATGDTGDVNLDYYFWLVRTISQQLAPDAVVAF